MGWKEKGIIYGEAKPRRILFPSLSKLYISSSLLYIPYIYIRDTYIYICKTCICIYSASCNFPW